MSKVPVIVVPLDGSRFSETALPIAAGVAHTLRASLALVRAHDVVLMMPSDSMAPMPLVDAGVDAELRSDQARSLARTADSMRPMIRQDVMCEMLDGVPEVAIADFAGRVDAALIIMSSHGRSGISGTLLGSVTREVIRTARRPVLVIRPREGQAPPAPASIEHVLIPLDGSAAAESVIAPATALLSGPRHVTLLQLTANPGLDPMSVSLAMPVIDTDAQDRALQESKRYLNAQARRLREQGLLVDTIATTAMSAGSAIAEAARDCGAGMVAMTTHGRGALGRLVMGSVAEAVLHACDVPMLIYRPPTV